MGTLVQFMLPRWVAVPIARLAGYITWRVNRGRREQVIENLRHILGPNATQDELEQVSLRVLTNLVVNYIDLLRVPVLRRRVAALADFDPVHVDPAMAQGRGLILVTAHLGNWDLAGTFLGARGYPISAVVEPIPRGWTRTFNRYRNATAMETIPIPDRKALARAILRKRLIALVADRDLTGHGLPCPAFGAVRSYPKGPAAYALKYDVPLVLGWFAFQNRPGHPPYHAVIEPPMTFESTGNADADVAAFTRLIATRLNELIARYPDQWLVFKAGWQESSQTEMQNPGPGNRSERTT
jgi:KDO2-lipid IV(A) lauroyltransferase